VSAEWLLRALLLSKTSRLVLDASPSPSMLALEEAGIEDRYRIGRERTSAPRVRMGATVVSGRLPKEVIVRIVRQNFGRFRMCYEQGLGRNPALEGEVSVRFVIDRSGGVSNVSDNGSALPDAEVKQCVFRAFFGLSFPMPEGGIVTVVYPMTFSPG
jgi:hypothetical protein